MLGENPSLIQPSPASAAKRAPLVLIHDGSGLVFSYFWLGPLGRAVYGIHNPNFESGGAWDGGLRQMAEAYVPLIKSVVPSGKVLLGGWSLGGLLALEIAHLLAGDEDVAVSGLLLLDAGYPKVTTAEELARVISREDFNLPFSSHSASLGGQVQEAFRNALRMIDGWHPPTWSDKDTLPPPAILLKATDYVLGQGQELAAVVDVARQTERLGWDDYEHKFIRMVLSIPGHHFNIFDDDKVSP
ncbi:Polyketide synthase-like protein [Hapsidospora chrysogenum ATCC 11550]|uniref:Polyketide synthase-like protein n=1 Tax=Hapsidospora chrysogenum (strain ATCC 11550 / CBS 779.69 / DSM 880 / IAM 14645 / JCM 23072 / IMI 49137) TaxID=857340 RepID=A0A086T7L4_HAPC1|nr:Polyketide synthase-like protein [Hapsidospora chrysogenum ATCC 11550]